MVIRGLNATVNLECMKLFCETYDLSSLIKIPTCYKNPEKPSCIDFLLTSRPKSFQNLSVVEVGMQLLTKLSLENFNNNSSNGVTGLP